jgi:hypothetical protein
MKVLYAILVLSVAAIIVALGATWWRLRWHLRRPHHTPLNGHEPSQPEHPAETAEHLTSTHNTH